MLFRPSAQVLLYLRIDELADVEAYDRIVGAQSTDPGVLSLGREPGATFTDPAEALRLLDIQAETLEQSRNLLSPEEYDANRRNLEAQRDLILQDVISRDVDGARPWALLGVTPDLRYARVGILPRQVDVNRNGFRTADTAKVQIDWADVPFDPRILRSAAAEIVIGTVTDDEYQQGLQGVRDPVSGQLVSVVRQNPGAPLPDTTTRFAGWVDTWDVDLDGDQEKVQLELRDFTSLFLDTPVDGSVLLDLSLPLDQGIRNMLAQYPTLAGFPVLYQSARDGVAVPAPIPAMSLPPQQRSRSGRNAVRGRTADQRQNLWDMITDITVQQGLIPVVRGYELHLIDPRVVYGSDQGGIRRMVYGRNLSKLSFARKLGGVKVPTVEVRAYDPTIGRTRWARCPVRPGQPQSGVLGVTPPPPPLRANEVTPGGRRLDEKIQTFVLQNTTDPTQLGRAASSLFQQIGRQEIEGQIETSDISSWDLAAGQPFPVEVSDLLRLEAGDTLELLIAPRNQTQPDRVAITAGDWIGAERSARVAYLVGLGMPRRVAEQFAALQDTVASTLFRVQEVSITFDVDEGIKIKADFVNFLEIRELSTAQPTVAQAAEARGPSRSMVRVAADRRDALALAARDVSARRLAATRLAATVDTSAVQPSSVLQPPTSTTLAGLDADEVQLRRAVRDLA